MFLWKTSVVDGLLDPSLLGKWCLRANCDMSSLFGHILSYVHVQHRFNNWHWPGWSPKSNYVFVRIYSLRLFGAYRRKLSSKKARGKLPGKREICDHIVSRMPLWLKLAWWDQEPWTFWSVRGAWMLRHRLSPFAQGLGKVCFGGHVWKGESVMETADSFSTFFVSRGVFYKERDGESHRPGQTAVYMSSHHVTDLLCLVIHISQGTCTG